LEIIYRNS